jgi:hypothetical protein
MHVAPHIHPTGDPLAEFENSVKNARDHLDAAVAQTAGDLRSFDFGIDQSKGTIMINKEAFKGVRCHNLDADLAAEFAFRDYNWSVDRAIRALRWALGR